MKSKTISYTYGEGEASSTCVRSRCVSPMSLAFAVAKHCVQVQSNGMPRRALSIRPRYWRYDTPVPHSRWTHCLQWSHSSACWRCVTFLKHTLHVPGVAEISILSVVVKRKIVHDSSPYILGNTIWRCGRTRDSYSLCGESMHTSVGTNSVTDVHACLTVCRSQHNELLIVL